MLLHEQGVVGGVVVDDVDHDFEAEGVGVIAQQAEFFLVAVFGVDLAVVLDGVGTAEAAFFVELADGMDGHEPDDVDAHFAQAGQVGGDVGEGARTAVVAHVDFVDDEVAEGLGGGCCHMFVS